MKQLIPTTTKLTDQQLKTLSDIVIPNRIEELRKLSCFNLNQAEEALWLMGELEHLKKLRDNNLNGTANDPHPSLQAQSA